MVKQYMSTHQLLSQSASEHSSIASSVNQSNKCAIWQYNMVSPKCLSANVLSPNTFFTKYYYCYCNTFYQYCYLVTTLVNSTLDINILSGSRLLYSGIYILYLLTYLVRFFLLDRAFKSFCFSTNCYLHTYINFISDSCCP